MNTIRPDLYTIKLDHVDSTNSYASRILRTKKVPEGTVILTDNQTAGKGQAGNRWESEPGKNLTFSIILYPEFLNAENQFYLSMSFSNGIIDFLQRNQIPAAIKWPNDIWAGEGKIAGMLIENSIVGRRLKSSIIGIGLNVNQQIFPDVLGKVTSMCILTAREFSLNNIYKSIMENLIPWIDKIYHRDFGEIKNSYLNNLLALNEWRTYTDHTGRFEGRIVDVSESGTLIVKKRTGRIQSYSFKEIKY
ncbi:MAG: biotin--[acetyl-CoA-carboxylase] ligase [Bacteroidales bacterium]|nr:biotin--[acetyl-CoA-carboxylase] ligase [Bacteroidales bacterium]